MIYESHDFLKLILSSSKNLFTSPALCFKQQYSCRNKKTAAMKTNTESHVVLDASFIRDKVCQFAERQKFMHCRKACSAEWHESLKDNHNSICAVLPGTGTLRMGSSG